MIGTNYFLAILAQIVVSIFSFLNPILILRNLGVSGFGEYMVLISFLMILSAISTLGVGSEAKRHLSKFKKYNITSYLIQLTKTVIVSIVTCILLLAINKYYLVFKFGIDTHIILYFIVTLNIWNITIEWMKFSQLIKAYSIFVIFPHTILFLFNIMMYFLDANIEVKTLIYTIILSNFVVAAIAIFFVLKKSNEETFVFRSKIILDVKIGMPLTITSLVSSTILIIDRLILSSASSPEEVGIYASMYIVATMPVMLAKAIATIYTPILINKFENKKFHELKEISETLSLLVFITGIFWFALCWFNFDFLIEKFTGQKIDDNYLEFGSLFCIGSIAYGLFFIHSNVYYALGKTTIGFLIISTSGIMIFLISNFLINLEVDIKYFPIPWCILALINFYIFKMDISWRIEYNIFNQKILMLYLLKILSMMILYGLVIKLVPSVKIQIFMNAVFFIYYIQIFLAESRKLLLFKEPV